LKFSGKTANIFILCTTIFFATFGWAFILPHWKKVNLLEIAEIYRKEGKFDESLKAYDMLLKMAPEDAHLYRKVSEMYYTVSMQLLSSVTKTPYSSQAKSATPPNDIVKVNRNIRMSCIENARKAKVLVPALAASHAYLGRVIVRLFPNDRELLKEAENEFRIAVKLHKYKPGYLVWLSRTVYMLGNKKEAAEIAKRALRLNANPMLSDERAKLMSAEVIDMNQIIKWAEAE
jgi:tetratricopeptide (TPR) repeat protein